MSAQDKIDQAANGRANAGRELARIIRESTAQIARRLPAYLGDVAERYAAIALGTVQDSPGLRECTPASIVRGIVRAAEYGLALDGVLGHAYLVPYTVRGVKVAQFQLGYRGLVELMYRTGQWVSVQADVVHEHDALDYSMGTAPFLNHKPALTARGKRIAAYAVAHPTGGGVATFVLLSEEQVLEHRKASKAYAYKAAESIWEKYPDVAWRKSAVRELSKTVAMATDKSVTLRKAAVLDQRIDEGDEAVIVDAEVADEPPPGEAVDFTSGGKV